MMTSEIRLGLREQRRFSSTPESLFSCDGAMEQKDEVLKRE